MKKQTKRLNEMIRGLLAGQCKARNNTFCTPPSSFRSPYVAALLGMTKETLWQKTEEEEKYNTNG
jgi:hypothetical protein